MDTCALKIAALQIHCYSLAVREKNYLLAKLEHTQQSTCIQAGDEVDVKTEYTHPPDVARRHVLKVLTNLRETAEQTQVLTSKYSRSVKLNCFQIMLNVSLDIRKPIKYCVKFNFCFFVTVEMSFSMKNMKERRGVGFGKRKRRGNAFSAKIFWIELTKAGPFVQLSIIDINLHGQTFRVG